MKGVRWWGWDGGWLKLPVADPGSIHLSEQRSGSHLQMAADHEPLPGRPTAGLMLVLVCRCSGVVLLDGRTWVLSHLNAPGRCC
jgi:hypothetical protein